MRVRFLVLAAVAASVAMAQAPNVSENGVVNAASFARFGEPGHPTAPGSIVSIFGTNLASSLATASTVPLSTSLGGVSVTFNGTAAPLFFVSSGQINAQLPGNLAGTTASVVVTNSGGASTSRTIQINQVSPAIFTLNQQGTGQGAIFFANSLTLAARAGAFAPNFESRPARAGDILTIFVNGLGPVDPPIQDGRNSLDALRSTTNRPTVLIGNLAVPDGDVLFSGLAPQFVALYQINFRMPTGVAANDAAPIRIRIGGVESSSQVTFAVQ
jgi:uncharacterized protein (TIGR03437 family)